MSTADDACSKCGHALTSDDGCSECPNPVSVAQAWPLFACCGEWHSGPPCPCRCGHAYEQHTDSIGCVECKGGSCVKYVGTKDGDDDE